MAREKDLCTEYKRQRENEISSVSFGRSMASRLAKTFRRKFHVCYSFQILIFSLFYYKTVFPKMKAIFSS